MKLTIKIVPEGTGSIMLSPKGRYVSPGIVDYPLNTMVTMTAVSSGSIGWFERWEGDIAGDSNPTPIVLDRDRTVKAVFASVAAPPGFPPPPAPMPDPGPLPPPPGDMPTPPPDYRGLPPSSGIGLGWLALAVVAVVAFFRRK